MTAPLTPSTPPTDFSGVVLVDAEAAAGDRVMPSTWQLLANIRDAERALALAESAALGKPLPHPAVERAASAVVQARAAWRFAQRQRDGAAA